MQLELVWRNTTTLHTLALTLTALGHQQVKSAAAPVHLPFFNEQTTFNEGPEHELGKRS